MLSALSAVYVGGRAWVGARLLPAAGGDAMARPPSR